MDRRLQVAIEAARAGGEVALRYFRGALQVERKADASPVTVADREAEKAMTAVLCRAFPEYGVLGEEFGASGAARSRWIVDPIDGTKSFVRGIPFFASLVALEEDGEVTTGAVYAPALGELLYAQKGAGAFDDDGPLHVSAIAALDEAMVVHGGLVHLHDLGHWPAFTELTRRSGRQRGYGDYFGYTFIARGQAEVMVDVDLKPWDLAALKVIIEEAGGRFTDFQGRSSIYGGSAVASNGRVHESVLAILRGGGAAAASAG
jgi:histidinol phosphatase-like enzyme (inositol monophosphatase family)